MNEIPKFLELGLSGDAALWDSVVWEFNGGDSVSLGVLVSNWFAITLLSKAGGSFINNYFSILSSKSSSPFVSELGLESQAGLAFGALDDEEVIKNACEGGSGVVEVGGLDGDGGDDLLDSLFADEVRGKLVEVKNGSECLSLSSDLSSEVFDESLKAGWNGRNGEFWVLRCVWEASLGLQSIKLTLKVELEVFQGQFISNIEVLVESLDEIQLSSLCSSGLSLESCYFGLVRSNSVSGSCVDCSLKPSVEGTGVGDVSDELVKVVVVGKVRAWSWEGLSWSAKVNVNKAEISSCKIRLIVTTESESKGLWRLIFLSRDTGENVQLGKYGCTLFLQLNLVVRNGGSDSVGQFGADVGGCEVDAVLKSGKLSLFLADLEEKWAGDAGARLWGVWDHCVWNEVGGSLSGLDSGLILLSEVSRILFSSGSFSEVCEESVNKGVLLSVGCINLALK